MTVGTVPKYNPINRDKIIYMIAQISDFVQALQ